MNPDDRNLALVAYRLKEAHEVLLDAQKLLRDHGSPRSISTGLITPCFMLFSLCWLL